MVSAFDEGERGLETLVKDLGFALSLQPVLVKELTHIFSHRKWFMKAFRGDLTYVGDAKNITIGAIQKQLPKAGCSSSAMSSPIMLGQVLMAN